MSSDDKFSWANDEIRVTKSQGKLSKVARRWQAMVQQQKAGKDKKKQ